MLPLCFFREPQSVAEAHRGSRSALETAVIGFSKTQTLGGDLPHHPGCHVRIFTEATAVSCVVWSMYGTLFLSAGCDGKRCCILDLPFLWMFLRTPLFLSKKTHLRPSSGVRRLGATAAQPGGSGEVRLLTRRRTLLLLLCPSSHSSPAVLAVGRRTEQTRGSRRGMPLPLSQAHQPKKKHSSRTGLRAARFCTTWWWGIAAVCAPLTKLPLCFFFLLTGDSSRCESRRFLVGGCPPVSTSPPVSRPSVPPDNPIATHTHKIEEAAGEGEILVLSLIGTAATYKSDAMATPAQSAVLPLRCQL